MLIALHHSFSTGIPSTASEPSATRPSCKNIPSSSQSTGSCSPPSKLPLPSNPWSNQTSRSPILTRFSPRRTCGISHSTFRSLAMISILAA